MDLKLEANLYTILQILSVNIFEQILLLQIVKHIDYKSESDENHKQLTFMNYLLEH